MKITKKYLQELIKKEVATSLLEMEFGEWDDCDNYDGKEKEMCLKAELKAIKKRKKGANT